MRAVIVSLAAAVGGALLGGVAGAIAGGDTWALVLAALTGAALVGVATLYGEDRMSNRRKPRRDSKSRRAVSANVQDQSLSGNYALNNGGDGFHFEGLNPNEVNMIGNVAEGNSGHGFNFVSRPGPNED